MINEEFQAPGSFEIPFAPETPRDKVDSLKGIVREFGHIVVTPQWLDPFAAGDAGMLAAARYTGVVLQPLDRRDDRLAVLGAGVHWHLGDAGGDGPLMEFYTTLSANTLSAALIALMPDALDDGNIVNTGLSTYTGRHGWENPYEAWLTICQTLGAHYRVNPDFTVDACGVTRDDVYRVTPAVVAVRTGSGSDPLHAGVPTRRMRTLRDASNYVTDVVLLDEDADGNKTFVDRSVDSAHTYKNGRGLPLHRVAVVSRPSSAAGNLGVYLDSELSDRVVVDELEVDTDHFELVGGNFAVGDFFYVYDPETGVVDYANEVIFRGEPIWPKKIRLLSASWPLTFGMGVYYRPGLATITGNDWIDLTRWIAWEDG